MVSGMFILLVTLVFCLKGIAMLFWTVSSHWHAYLGLVITVITIFAPIGGFVTIYYNLYSKFNTDFYMKVRASHQYFGYFMIVLCQVEIFLGARMCTHVGTKGRSLGVSQMATFYAMVFVCEVIFQIVKRRNWQFRNPAVVLTKEEFRRKSEEGEDLVILDDLVLKVNDFKYYHPGGFFTIHQNRSRDVSKFFYGGYQMNGSALASTRPYTHSNWAVMTANKLVVGKYEQNAHLLECLVKDRYQVTLDTATFVFSYGRGATVKLESDFNSVAQISSAVDEEGPYSSRALYENTSVHNSSHISE